MSIEAKDWRIGNWYNWYADGKYYQYQVEAKDFVMGNMPNYEGIPLTQDILLKCGFSNWISNEYALSNGFFCMWFKFYKNGNIYVVFCGNRKKYLKGEPMLIQYLHQLQNLYCSLTKEELTVNL